MPHIIIKLMRGRSEQQKQELADAITRDVMTYANAGEDSVSVAIEDIAPGDWAKQVFEPDIAAKPHSIYKKPGYV
ncbi:MAG: tautomerase family protein [Kofleriaceae bacterium]